MRLCTVSNSADTTHIIATKSTVEITTNSARYPRLPEADDASHAAGGYTLPIMPFKVSTKFIIISVVKFSRELIAQ